MKTRNGFVSNSSSSSFIIHKPSDKELNKEVIKECFVKAYGWEEEEFDEDFNRKAKAILETFGDKGELIFADIEYGAEGDMQDILGQLGIKYLDEESI